MRHKFSQSLVGYDPQYVEQTLQLMQERQQAELAALQQELTTWTSEAESLEREIAQLEQPRQSQQSKQSLDQLLPAYLEAVALLLQARHEIAEMELASKQRIAIKQEELQQLQAHLAQLPREIKAVAGRYQRVLKRAEEK